MYFRRVFPFTAALAASIAMPCLAGAAHNAPSHAALKTALPPFASTSFTAVVSSKGKLVRGSATAASTTEDGAGTFEVDFPNDVSQCAYVATVGEPDSNGSQPAAFITVVGRNGNANGVYVETYNLKGHAKAYPFHIDVGC